MRPRGVLLAGVIALATVLLLTFLRPSDTPTVTPVAAPSATPLVRLLPAEVQAVADRIAPPFDGVLRVDRKVAVQLRDVDRRDSPGIMGATDGTWAIAVVGEFRQTWGFLPAPNHQCHIWFVNAAGFAFASQGGAVSKCDPYMSAK